MDKKVLVDRDIHDGVRLAQALYDAGFRARHMFWVLFPESAGYRLYVASPLIDEIGPIQAYTRMKEVLDQLAPPVDIPLTAITIVSPQDQLVQAVSQMARVAIVGGVGRIGPNSVGNVYVDDLIVYGVAPLRVPVQ